MFPPLGAAKRRQGQEPDIDGKQARAVEILRANPRLSARALARLLKEHGIKRGKDPAQYAAEEAEARAIIGAHPNLSLPQAVGLLAARGIKRNTGWVSAERSRVSFSEQSK